MRMDYERAELMFTCPRCGVHAGEWCVTSSGGHASFLHSPRWQLVHRVAEMAGWVEEVDELMRQRRVYQGATRELIGQLAEGEPLLERQWVIDRLRELLDAWRPVSGVQGSQEDR